MSSRGVCLPCTKGNCGHCMGDVVNITTETVDQCLCEQGDHEKCESCGTYLTDPADCEHKHLCFDCSNECRTCTDTDTRHETLERRGA